jgi:hypothetical protein
MRQHRLLILVWVVISMLIGCNEDDNPPRVISITPPEGPNGEVLVTGARRGDANGPIIKAQFNEALLASSVPADALILEYNGEALPGINDFVPSINMVAFEPDEQLRFLRQYDVTLKKGITDLEGNRDTEGKKWSFRVRDGSFSSPINVEANSGAAIDPQITVGSGEHGQYVWSQIDPGTTRSSIWARSLQINVLDEPVRVEIDNINSAVTPQVAVDNVGNATAVWSHFDGTNWRIRANSFTPDVLEQVADSNVVGTWGTAKAVVTITIASPGIVSWTAHGLENDREVVLRTTDSLPTGLNTATTYYVRNASANTFELSATPGGASIDTSGSQSGIHSVTAVAEIISDAGSDATVPQIAVDTDGNYIAVWVQSDGRVYANRYDDADGNWEGPTTIDADTGAPTAPQIVFDGGNNAIAVWAQNDRIYASRYTEATGTWGAATLIDDGNGTAVTAPQIAVDPDTDGGSAIVVWSQSDGTHTSIWANRFNGTAWDGAITIEDNNANDANTPQIAMNAAGTAAAIWSQSVDSDVPPTEVTISIASPAIVSWTAHGLANNREVVLETTGLLPAGLTAGKRYYVRDAAADSFELSATPGGASINTTDDPSTSSDNQSGTHTATAVPRFRIYSSFFEAGGDWQDTPDGDWDPVLIDDFDPAVYIPQITEAGISTEPQIIIDGDGNAIAVWTIRMASINEGAQEDGITTFIGASRYRGLAAHENLRGWAVPGIFQSGVATSGDYDSPQIAVFQDFTAVATWEVDNEISKTVTVTIASPAVVISNSHNLENDHAVVLQTSGSLPTGLTEGATYYVRNATANSFELSATPGGASIDTSGTQSGTHTLITFITSVQTNYFF